MKLFRSITTQAMRVHSHLRDVDPDISSLISKEQKRQRETVNLIASENYVPTSVLEAIGSVLTNKYSEGYPRNRYYAGNQFIDQIELLCQQRALEAFGLSNENWGVNVQALSGSPANFAVFSALCEPHDKILSLDLPHGGHLSHGYQTDTRKVSLVSKYFSTIPYRVDEKTGRIDYDEISLLADRCRPKVIVCGASAYPRIIDYKKMRDIAECSKSILLCDMAHVAGLVASGLHPSPFEYAHIVTTTSHKTLRGPRGALIFYRQGIIPGNNRDNRGDLLTYDFHKKINEAVFPGLQGGPHNHNIAGLAVCLKLAKSNEFIEYQQQVLKNSKIMSNELVRLGYKLVSGGTDNHLILVDLRRKDISGAKAEIICEFVNIIINKNTIPGDRSALNPSGIRLGSPAMTTRGAMEDDFVRITKFLHQALRVAEKELKCSNMTIQELSQTLKASPPEDLVTLGEEVQSFAERFDYVGQEQLL